MLLVCASRREARAMPENPGRRRQQGDARDDRRVPARPSGARFTHAASGLEAIERLSLKPFDLVVLDLNMPDIGGIEVVEFVRGQDKLRDLPIIVVTTRGDEASRERALERGRLALHDQAVHSRGASSPRSARCSATQPRSAHG